MQVHHSVGMARKKGQKGGDRWPGENGRLRPYEQYPDCHRMARIAGSGNRAARTHPRQKNGRSGFTGRELAQVPPPMFLLDSSQPVTSELVQFRLCKPWPWTLCSSKFFSCYLVVIDSFLLINYVTSLSSLIHEIIGSQAPVIPLFTNFLKNYLYEIQKNWKKSDVDNYLSPKHAKNHF
jgi:hypothetical protein